MPFYAWLLIMVYAVGAAIALWGASMAREIITKETGEVPAFLEEVIFVVFWPYFLVRFGVFGRS